MPHPQNGIHSVADAWLPPDTLSVSLCAFQHMPVPLAYELGNLLKSVETLLMAIVLELRSLCDGDFCVGCWLLD
jgi:hypothetical protein